MANKPKVVKKKIEELERFASYDDSKAFVLTGIVSNLKDDSFVISGGLIKINVTESSFNKNDLSFDKNENKYIFNNSHDFDSSKIQNGQEVTIKAVIKDDGIDLVATGVILKVKEHNDKFDRIILLSREQKSTGRKEGWKAWKKNWKKKSVGERVFLWIMFAFFIVYGFTLVFPLIWALINSLKPSVEYDLDSFSLPIRWTFENYEKVFVNLKEDGTDILSSLWNSIWMSALSTLLGLFASCLTSYVVAKYRFKMSGLIYTLVIFIQVIPLVGGVAGMYQLMWNTLGIADKPILIWPIWFGGFGFSFLMLYSAFKSVPWSYAESAFIDGAGHFTTFLRIMLPSVKPVLASLFVVNFINAWNDYMTAYLYLPSYKPLSLMVYSLQSDASRISFPVYLAVIVISVIPTIILFISFQKLIMENTTTGGLKG